MFSEAGASSEQRKKDKRLVLCVGNTYSNLIYSFAGTLILMSLVFGSSNHDTHVPFLWADALFAVMLLILAFCSIGWHATHQPIFHYPDLWSMECVIVYCIIRSVCVALKATGYLHYSCPFAGRTRLFNGNKEGNARLFVLSGVCAYAALPLLYVLLPAVVLLFFLGNIGSWWALTISMVSLGFGWGYRMWERFCCDASPLVLWVLHHTHPSSRAQLWLAALVSPTAVLHWSTGITLLFSFAHQKSLDSIVF
ncbi:unnamed protein product [Heterosigma akashiwo]